jgi:hypothetical protein
MEKAKTQANEIMTLIFGPVLQQLGKGYKLNVSFKKMAPSLEEEYDAPEPG